VARAAKETKAIITIEEHGSIGGLGSIVSQLVGQINPIPVRNLTLPDCPVITGTSAEVFKHYMLNAEGLVSAALELMNLD